MDWNERFSGSEYVYGTEPNAFLAEHAKDLRGPVLSLAEGEGRNGVFLASLGLVVHGVDASHVGVAKAQALARSRRVEIRTEVRDLAAFEPAAESYGAVVSIFAHLPSSIRQRLCPLVERCLVPGGILLLEAYAESQLPRTTGGPKDLDMLMTIEKIAREFPNLEPLLLREVEREIVEGGAHSGLGSVVQFIGRKPARSTSMPITFSCDRVIAATPAAIFGWIADTSTWSRFRGYWFLPGIRHAEYEVRTDGMVGSRVRVLNTDGSRHVEEIYRWIPERRIGMRLSDFGPPLSRIAAHMEEEWTIEPRGQSASVVRVLRMYPRSAAARPKLWMISLLLRRAIARSLEEMG